ncbi:MAG: hypothetical protein ACP59X_16155 [Solidesulfovibrio sp. DCME]|uniref:hypothetical protein n=1 Tax=Solidesulfovibrio sp. DCME TaxID=3447380 RepID=UPI003D121108
MERTYRDHGPREGMAMPFSGTSYLADFVEKARLEIIVGSEAVGKLYALKSALQQMGVEEFLESSLLCHGGKQERTASYRGVEYTTPFSERIKLEFLVPVDSIAPFVEAIKQRAKDAGMKNMRLCLIPQVFPIDWAAS